MPHLVVLVRTDMPTSGWMDVGIGCWRAAPRSNLPSGRSPNACQNIAKAKDLRRRAGWVEDGPLQPEKLAGKFFPEFGTKNA